VGDDNAKVVDGSLVERALFGFQVEVVFLEVGEDFVGEGMNVRETGVEEQDIVQVDNEVASVDKVQKNRVHKGLEGSRGVAETEGHNKGFKKAKGAFKGGFRAESRWGRSVEKEFSGW
jgi:hypothetical protein